MSGGAGTSTPAFPSDRRALVAIDLGAESCRVSLLRWGADGAVVELVHRFPNAPRQTGDGLRWDFASIEQGVDHGLRLCAQQATEGIRSIAVDGWAVDYVRLDDDGNALADPFCYRDERTVAAETDLHRMCSPEQMRAITGVELARINTIYQLHADRLSGHSGRWLNLPEYLLARLGGRPVAERTNATHSQMIDLETGNWSEPIFAATGLDPALCPEIVPSGTVIGQVTGALANLPAFAGTLLIAPACHDTASAVAGIPAHGEDWAYISSGTWSLVGTTLAEPRNGPAVQADNFTNLGAAGGRYLFHKSVNGMWLMRQSMEEWARRGGAWDVVELVARAEQVPCPAGLLDVDEPDLLTPGAMPAKINAQRVRRGLCALDESPENAPEFASLILHSLASRYAEVLRAIADSSKILRRLYLVGGGSQNLFLGRLTAEATGLEVYRGAPESSTIGNFAVQLAALEGERTVGEQQIAAWTAILQETPKRLQRSGVSAYCAGEAPIGTAPSIGPW